MILYGRQTMKPKKICQQQVIYHVYRDRKEKKWIKKDRVHYRVNHLTI